MLDLLPIPSTGSDGSPCIWFDDSKEIISLVAANRLFGGVTTPAVRVLLYNLIISALLERAEQRPVPVIVALRKADWKLPPRNYGFREFKTTYTNFRSALESLTAAGLVSVIPGSRVARRRSSLVPTQKFHALIEATEEAEIRHLIERGWILLRNSKSDDGSRSLLSYSETNLVQDMKYRLRTINNNSVKHSYTYVSEHSFFRSQRTALSSASVRYNRVFIETFESLGRFYADFQRLSKSERASIEINGQETVELDYGSVSLSLAYHHTVGKLPEGDLYELPGISSEFRPVLKKIPLILLNCTKWNQARAAIQGNIPKNLGLTPTQLKDLVLEKHKPIADYFLTGRGLEMQYLDSRIAEIVLLSFARIGKPILAIHDSFRVLASDREMLLTQMQQAYQIVANSPAYTGELPRISEN